MKVLYFAIFAIFDQLYPQKVSKPQNREIKYPKKWNTCRVWNSLFPKIWTKYDIDIRTWHISTYSNEIRISVTYLIKITLINNRKINIPWDFRFLFSLKLQNIILVKCFTITKSWNYVPAKFNAFKVGLVSQKQRFVQVLQLMEVTKNLASL